MDELHLDRITLDKALSNVFKEAKIIACQTQEVLNTAHVLFALFTYDNPASLLLVAEGINEEVLLSHLDANARERQVTLGKVIALLEKNTARFSAQHAGVLLLLLSLLRVQDSLACYLMSKAGLDLDRATQLVLVALNPDIPRTDTIIAPEQLHITMLPQKSSTPFDLDPKRFPWLTMLGRNLTAMAYHNQLDCAIGREQEISQIIDTLGKRRANNPCLVGDPGVGKTAIVEGLAIQMAKGDSQVAALEGKALIELDMNSITAGTSMRGSLSERMQGLKRDMEEAHGRVIVFIDEIHTLMKMGGGDDSGSDAADGLKSVLARGKFPCIGSTTSEEYKKYIEADAALERRFVRIQVDEPDEQETIKMLAGIVQAYEAHHGVKISSEAIEASVQLADRFIHDRKLPGKALDLLDFAMSRAKREGCTTVGRREVAKCCSDLAHIPPEHLVLEPGERLSHLVDHLRSNIFGQDKALEQIAQVIRQGFAGFFSRQPSTLLLVGPSGVGKTTTACEIGKFLYGRNKNFLYLDMADFNEMQSVSRLIGSPPGYIGYEQGGYLTEFLHQTPHCVIVLENISLAHHDVFAVILQLLKEGKISDSKGTEVFAKNAIVIMTAQLSAHDYHDRGHTMGFTQSSSSGESDEGVVLKDLKHMLPVELWKHILAKVVFSPLSSESIKSISLHALQSSVRTLKKNRNIELHITPPVEQHIAHLAGQKREEGAWSVGSIVKRLVEIPLAEAIVNGVLHNNTGAELVLENGKIMIIPDIKLLEPQ